MVNHKCPDCGNSYPKREWWIFSYPLGDYQNGITIECPGCGSGMDLVDVIISTDEDLNEVLYEWESNK